MYYRTSIKSKVRFPKKKNNKNETALRIDSHPGPCCLGSPLLVPIPV